MRRQAPRDRAHLGSGAGSGARRLDLRVGSVERLPFPDASFDHAVGVNTVAVWPDLEAGLRELHRVLRPGGRLLLGWHGRHSPNRMQRRLGLSEQRIAEIQQAITRVFGPTDRADLTHLVTWQARRQ